MTDVIVHAGHCFRRRGATGTQGPRGTEQAFVARVAVQMRDLLTVRGFDVFVAYPTINENDMPTAKVFVSLHQDGSRNPNARGASIGYPTSDAGGDLGQLWKAHYTLAGWPSGFRPDNYSAGLRRFYGFRKANADAKLLLEHGFATNELDANWMWDNLGSVVKANADAITQFLGPELVPTPPEGDAMQIINDTEQQRMFAGWDKDGTQHVREYRDYRGTAVGDPLPGISFVIDEQVAAGNIVKV